MRFVSVLDCIVSSMALNLGRKNQIAHGGHSAAFTHLSACLLCPWTLLLDLPILTNQCMDSRASGKFVRWACPQVAQDGEVLGLLQQCVFYTAGSTGGNIPAMPNADAPQLVESI